MEEETDIYMCVVCLEDMIDRRPRNLRCNHSFCHQCLEQLLNKFTKTITCPTCRFVTPVNNLEQDLPINFTLRKYKDREDQLRQRLEIRSQEASGSEDIPQKIPVNPDISHDAKKILMRLRDGKLLPSKRFNIMVIGRQGVGKSAFTNSLLMALNIHGYQNLVEKGGYGEGGLRGKAAITLALKSTKLFSNIPKSSGELSYLCQPYVYDVPGFDDVDDPNITILLKMIIKGKIKEGLHMSDLLKMKEKQLKSQTVLTGSEERKVHVIFIVHAATDPLPENLFNVVNEAARQHKAGKKIIPVFGLITKLDLLKRPHLPPIVKAFAQKIGAAGSEEKIFRSSLYCYDVTQKYERNHEIDTVMCEIWKTILDAMKPQKSKGK